MEDNLARLAGFATLMPMTLAPGTKFGAYEVLAAIGCGGMGEVYRAHDSKLHRDVALKVLPQVFASDSERLARFQREAQVLASLSHPNIGTIYGLEEGDGLKALVLELVDGPTVADRVAEGRIPLDEALAIAKQITEALEVAHEHGIIHRDLKPANIKLNADGTVKVLDFGLAKLTADEASGAGEAGGVLSQSPTITSPAAMTRAGVILGTAAYMSPEQARGMAVDRRTDIWAFGCVLFEILTGKRAFEGDDVTDTLAAIVRGEPDWSALPAATPASMHRLLRRCLVKDVKKRWQAVGDLRVEIEAVLTDPRGIEIQAGPLTTPQPAWKIAALVLLGTVVGSAMSAGVLWRLRPPIPAAKITRFSFALADGQLTGTGRLLVAVSPDGASVVYVANNQLYLRRMEDLEPRPILGTNGGVSVPFFSPDGQWVGFWSSTDSTLKKIAITGGAAVLLCAATNPFGATWEGDTIVFGQFGAGILAVPATGGKPEVWVKTSPGETADSPQILPGGNTVLFTVTKATGINRWDSADIAVSSRETGERKVLIHGGSAARYVSTGHILYAVGANLLAVPFELERLEVTGGPVPIAEGVMRTTGTGANAGAANFGVSHDGTFIYVPGTAGGATPRTLVWVDRQGHEEPLGAEPQPYAVPRISPDGTRVVAHVENPVNTHIVVYELSRKTLQRLTFDKTPAYRPTWAPDGRSVNFRSDQDGPGVYRKASDGTGASERVTSVLARFRGIKRAAGRASERVTRVMRAQNVLLIVAVVCGLASAVPSAADERII